MKRTIPWLLVASLAGCSVLSSGPTPSSGGAPGAGYEAMASMPPEPRREDLPRLAEKQVWIPGYYQPASGTWVWRPGQVAPEKIGYKLVPASYREENGKVLFSPPLWRRSDLVDRGASK